MDTITVKHVSLWICEPCLGGEGDECHTPGCALFLHDVGARIHPGLYEVLEERDEPA